MYTILEDCSPYFIRFKYANLQLDLAFIKSFLPNTSQLTEAFTHYRLKTKDGAMLLDSLPMSDTLNLMKERVSFFVTKPGHYYQAHKDGSSNRMSINYTLKVLDDKCVTSWYDDVGLNYPIDTKGGTSRELEGFIKENHVSIKSNVFLQDECILFNTDIYHDFDNTESDNERIVLTLRSHNQSSLFFEDAKRLLF